MTAREPLEDHTRLSIGGEDWWIQSMRGGLVFCANATGRCVLDMRFVDWDDFEESSITMVRAHHA